MTRFEDGTELIATETQLYVQYCRLERNCSLCSKESSMHGSHMVYSQNNATKRSTFQKDLDAYIHRFLDGSASGTIQEIQFRDLIL